MPSRVDSLFAFADPLEALAFTETTGSPQQVWEAIVDEGVRWAAVDMRLFFSLEPEHKTADGYRYTWERHCENARRYWNPVGSLDICEVLVAGPLNLTRRIELIPYLREVGLVA